MRTLRVGTSGLAVSSLGLGTFDWGYSVTAGTAQNLLDTYRQAGGSLVEFPRHNHRALDVFSSLTDTENLTLCARIGTSQARIGSTSTGGGTAISHETMLSRGEVLKQTHALLRRLSRSHIDVVILDGFDAATPLEETASALDTLLRMGDITYVAAADHTGWQLACLRAADIPVVASFTEYSLICRHAEAEVFPAAEYLGIGIVAGAVLGRGVLSGQYEAGTPRTSRAATHAHEWVSTYLTPEYEHMMAGIIKAAESLEATPIDIALAWSNHDKVSARLVSPRTVEQLQRVLASSLELAPEIKDVLNQITESAR